MQVLTRRTGGVESTQGRAEDIVPTAVVDLLKTDNISDMSYHTTLVYPITTLLRTELLRLLLLLLFVKRLTATFKA